MQDLTIHGMVARVHRQELHRQAQLAIRRPVGRFLVRLGSRLNNEPRRMPRLATTGDAG